MEQVEKQKKKRRLSVAIYPLNLGGSNAASLELAAIFTPPYNAARYGISLITSPWHADIVMLSGSGTAKSLEPALRLLASLPDEVKLVALGSEAITGQPYAGSYGAADVLLPADSEETGEFKLPPGKSIAAYVAGSPPDPQSIIDTILEICNT